MLTETRVFNRGGLDLCMIDVCIHFGTLKEEVTEDEEVAKIDEVFFKPMFS